MALPPLSVEEAEAIHAQSALLRPFHAAEYGDADEYTQAATLLWGLVLNHPFIQENKRTATAIVFFFLERAGYLIAAPEQAVLDLVYAVEAGATAIADVAAWLRQHTTLAP